MSYLQLKVCGSGRARSGQLELASEFGRYTLIEPPQHVMSVLSCISCSICLGPGETLADHWWTSPVHPKCTECRIGFENSADLSQVRVPACAFNLFGHGLTGDSCSTNHLVQRYSRDHLLNPVKILWSQSPSRKRTHLSEPQSPPLMTEAHLSYLTAPHLCQILTPHHCTVGLASVTHALILLLLSADIYSVISKCRDAFVDGMVAHPILQMLDARARGQCVLSRMQTCLLYTTTFLSSVLACLTWIAFVLKAYRGSLNPSLVSLRASMNTKSPIGLH